MILDADLTLRMFFQVFLSIIFQLGKAQSGYEFVSQNNNYELPFQSGVSTVAVGGNVFGSTAAFDQGTAGFEATSSGSGMRLEDSIPGIPAVDYPIFPFVPPTQFTCDGKLPGYYADTETGCQVFHICYDDRMASFLCPNGTTFHQQFFVCDWWFNSDCSQAPSFYSVNANLFITHHSPQTSPSETGSTIPSQSLSNYAAANQIQTGQSVFSNQGSYSQVRQSIDQQEEQETPKDLRQYFNSGYYSLQPSQITVNNDLNNQVQGVSTETNIGNIQQQQSGLIKNQQPFIQPSQNTQAVNLESFPQKFDLSQNLQQSIEPLQYTQFFQGTQSVNSQQLPPKSGMGQDQQQFIQSSQSPQIVKTSQITQSPNLQQLTQKYQKAENPSVTSSFQQTQQPQSLISQRLQSQGTIKQSLQFSQSGTNKNPPSSQNSQLAGLNTQQPILSQKLLNSVGNQQDILKQAGQRQQVGNTISAQNGQAYSYKSSEPNQLYQNTFFNSEQFPGIQRTGLGSTKTTGMRYKKAPKQDYLLENFQEENSTSTIHNLDNNTLGTETNVKNVLTSTSNPIIETVPENSVGETEQSINRLGGELLVLEVGEAFGAQIEPQIITELNFQDVTTKTSSKQAISTTRSPETSGKTAIPFTLSNQPKQQIVNNSQNIFRPSQQIFAKTVTAKALLLAGTKPLMHSQLATNNKVSVHQKYSQALPNQELTVKQQQIPVQGNANQQSIQKTSLLQNQNQRNVNSQIQSAAQKPSPAMINKQNMKEQSVINTPLSIPPYSNGDIQQQVVQKNGAQTTTSSLQNVQNLTGAELLVTQPATYARAQQLPVSLKQAVYNQVANQQYIQASGNLNNQIYQQKIQNQGQKNFIQAKPSKLSTPYYTPQSPLFGKRIVPLKARNNSEQPNATRRTLQSLGSTAKHWPNHVVSRSVVRDSIPTPGNLLITKLGPTPTFHTYWQRYSTYP